jgi:hypothetical protein
MDISNRILNMEITPLFQTTVRHGEFEDVVPDMDSTIQVKIQYYDGRETYAYVENQEELQVMNLYLARNREYWEDNNEYD